MADEIQPTFGLKVANGSFVTRINTFTLQIDQASLGAHMPIVNVGTAEEDLATGDVANLGCIYVRNLDTANFVTIGPKSGGIMVPFLKLKPGEWCWLRLSPGVVWRWQADTATVKCQVMLFED